MVYQIWNSKEYYLNVIKIQYMNMKHRAFTFKCELERLLLEKIVLLIIFRQNFIYRTQSIILSDSKNQIIHKKNFKRNTGTHFHNEDSCLPFSLYKNSFINHT